VRGEGASSAPAPALLSSGRTGTGRRRPPNPEGLALRGAADASDGAARNEYPAAMSAPDPSPPRAPGPVEDAAARLGPAAAALATFALHLACLGRYGIFRDELYFLVCGERLAVGYVDQPPGIALVARLAGALFGTSVVGLRLLPWLATSATVYLTGRLAARLSPRRAAPTLAAVGAFACLVLVGTSHFLSMNAFDPLLVIALAHLLVRLSEGDDPRLWVAVGGLAGLAVLFKYTSGAIVVALLLGVILTPARRSLATGWAAVGAAFALLTVLPNFAWQASHGFPFLELVRNGVRYKNAPTTLLRFLAELLFEANPGDAPIWLGGLAFLLFAARARQVRFLGLGGLIYLAALALGDGKPYYAAPFLPVLLGAGGAAAAELDPRPRTWRLYAAGLVASALAFSPLAVPILPLEAFLAYQAKLGLRAAPLERVRYGVLPQIFADQFGWRKLAEGVARAYESLPPEEREHAAVFAHNYGVASAVEIYGPQLGLPRGLAFSGHNQFWYWGIPPGRGDPLLVVSDAREDCHRYFREQILAVQLPSNPYVMPYEDAHAIWICRGALHPVRAMPEALKHFE